MRTCGQDTASCVLHPHRPDRDEAGLAWCTYCGGLTGAPEVVNLGDRIVRGWGPHEALEDHTGRLPVPVPYSHLRRTSEAGEVS